MRTTWWALTAAVAITFIAGLPHADAIPAFARRERVSCQMCHFRPPELNQDGHNYVRRGLREEPGGMKAMGPVGQAPAEQTMEGMPSTAMPPVAQGMPGMTMPSATQSMGGMPGMAVPPTAGRRAPLGAPLALPGGEYWALLAHPGVVAQRGAEPEFLWGVVDLWLVGPRDPHWSEVANPSYDLDAGGFGWDQAYVQYVTRWDMRFQSARAGRVLPLAILLNQGGPSMTLSTPVVLSTPPDTGNPWTPATLLRAAEVGAVDLPSWSAYLGAGRPVLEDSDGVGAHTDVYASAERLLSTAGNSVGIYGYWGEITLGSGTPDRGFHRVGLFGNLYRKQQKWVAGYLAGRDTAADGTGLDSSGWFLLGEQLLSDRWAAYARYDGYGQDLVGGGSEHIGGPTLGASWWMRTEAWLTVEAQWLSTTGQETDRTLSAQVTLAF